jgi:hypothetical protein
MGQVDHSALRTNQAVIITFLTVAFITDIALLAFICGALLLTGSLLNKPAFLPIYRLLRGVGLVRPDLQTDRNEPHRFAQLVGTLVLLVGSLGFFLGASPLGWILTIVVILLASLNLFLGFCLGCTLYYWLARMGLPGFKPPPYEEAG